MGFCHFDHFYTQTLDPEGPLNAVTDPYFEMASLGPDRHYIAGALEKARSRAIDAMMLQMQGTVVHPGNVDTFCNHFAFHLLEAISPISISDVITAKELEAKGEAFIRRVWALVTDSNESFLGRRTAA